MERRWIMHVDMDAFFASVEQRDHPEWRGRPVIVGGLSARGVVSTASYEARVFGVHSAMPMSRARALCRDGIFVRPRIAVYREISEDIHRIMLRYAAEIEPLSLDEAFMDITGMGAQYRTLGAIGRSIKEDIRRETGLSASAGIAPNKFLAKMASDMKKPDGLCIIPYGKEADILAPLPIRRLWGVGQVTERKLKEAGFCRIGDLQQASVEALEPVCGSGARLIWELARGIDRRPVVAEREVKSIGDERTHETDLSDEAEIRRQIAIHSDIVASRLRQRGLAARTVSLKIRFASFTTVLRSASFEEGTSLQEDIYQAALRLLEKIPRKEGVRLTGVTASQLAEEIETVSLFDDRKDTLRRAARAVDAIQKQFGKTAIRKGFYWGGGEEGDTKKQER